MAQKDTDEICYEIAGVKNGASSGSHLLEVPSPNTAYTVEAASVDKGEDPDSTSNEGSRRGSTRLLSLSVQQNLRQLRQAEHRRKVDTILEKNAKRFEKQRLFECVTMVCFLTSFTGFTLYIVFAHGFHFAKSNQFHIINNESSVFIRKENESVEMMCQSDSSWEWCRWIHLDTFCDFEWTRSGIEKIACDIPEDRVQLIGDYNKHQCGIRLSQLDPEDRGNWQCELEKYYFGFSRRYGETVSTKINLAVIERPTTSTTPVATTAEETTTKWLTETSEEAVLPIDEEEEYKRKFFMLRIFVLGGIGSVLFVLAGMFWAYFMYLWKTLDSSMKRDHVTMGPDGPEMALGVAEPDLEEGGSPSKAAVRGRKKRRKKRGSSNGSGSAGSSIKKLTEAGSAVSVGTFKDAVKIVQLARVFGSKTIQNLQQPAASTGQPPQAEDGFPMETIQPTPVSPPFDD